jgi:hypothetical protein
MEYDEGHVQEHILLELDQEPSIARVLKNGWQAGSFKAQWQLGVFTVPFLSAFELLNLTTAILWPKVQQQPNRSEVPIEQCVSTCLRIFISPSHLSLLSFPSLRGWYVKFQRYIAHNLIHVTDCIDPSLCVQNLGMSCIYTNRQPCHNIFTATEVL